MHAYSIFTITMEGRDEDIRSATEFAAEALGEDYELERGIIEVDECYQVVWLDDIEEFAANMAKEFPQLSFTMKGVVDTTESSGELMDFVIRYSDGHLTSQNSCWYVVFYPSDDREGFFEKYGDLYTEEDYERFCAEEEQWFLLDSGDGDLVNEIPLSEPAEISLDQDETEAVEAESVSEENANEEPTETEQEIKPEKVGLFRRLFGARRKKSGKKSKQK